MKTTVGMLVKMRCFSRWVAERQPRLGLVNHVRLGESILRAHLALGSQNLEMAALRPRLPLRLVAAT